MIHREGYPSLIGYGVILSILIFLLDRMASPSIFWVVTVLGIGLYIFLFNFFRNPNREIQSTDDSVVLCPADGKVVVIEKVTESEYFQEERMQVSIFMSPLNVHVNRNPISGKVLYSTYHKGKFYKAWEPKASTDNERTTIVYENAKGILLMRQIAGALARRIVNYLQKGDEVVQGKDMGFIKLGSRVDLFLPLDSDIQVQVGQVVQGNIDVIAKW